MLHSRFRHAFASALAMVLLAHSFASAHYIWLRVEPGKGQGATTLRAFFNEDPEPDAAFTKYLKDLRLTVDGQTAPSELGTDSREARWLGKAPGLVDAERDLGVMTKGGKSYRLSYTARAQTEPVAAESKEAGDKLRVRLLKDGADTIQVLFQGKPVAKARIRLYPRNGEPTEIAADEKGQALVKGVSSGEISLWANHVDPTPGELTGKAFTETRYYATWTFTPTPSKSEADVFATLPAPAVNSFGGAVLGRWLYVYSGHTGKTHNYSVETTARHFRRLDLADRSKWEELPMPVGKDLQGVALVSDGRYLYRTGGMSAKNKPGEPEDLHSVADAAKFDPETKTWSDLRAMPEARSTHDAVVIGRKLYVVGGWTMQGDSSESTFPTTALVLDLDATEKGWKAIPQPFQRRALSIGEQGGKLYVLGGLVGGGMKVERRVDVYDPKSGQWTRGPDLPGVAKTDGFGTSAFNVGGRLYYSGMSGKVFGLSGDGKTWEAVGGLTRPRITHRLLPGPGGSLLAVGGNARGGQIGEIEALRVSPVPTPSGGAGR